MPSNFNETYPSKIYSMAQIASCGMQLTKNKEYFLVGYFHKNPHRAPAETVWTNHCAYLDMEFQLKLRNNSLIDCYKKNQ